MLATRHSAECRLWVIRYRSLRDENRSMSAMPRKRRLAVKTSSVAMGHELTSSLIRDKRHYWVMKLLFVPPPIRKLTKARDSVVGRAPGRSRVPENIGLRPHRQRAVERARWYDDFAPIPSVMWKGRSALLTEGRRKTPRGGQIETNHADAPCRPGKACGSEIKICCM